MNNIIKNQIPSYLTRGIVSLFIFLEKIYAQRKCPWGTKNRHCSRITLLTRLFTM